MQVILLDKVHKLGNLGDQVKVRAGFGRNYLIPQGKAIPANARNIAEFEAKRAELEKQVAANQAATQKRADALSALELTIPMLASEEGKLFGSVGASELVDAIKEAGGEAYKQEVLLPEGPIRMLGEYTIALNLKNSDIHANIKVSVVVG